MYDSCCMTHILNGFLCVQDREQQQQITLKKVPNQRTNERAESLLEADEGLKERRKHAHYYDTELDSEINILLKNKS